MGPLNALVHALRPPGADTGRRVLDELGESTTTVQEVRRRVDALSQRVEEARMRAEALVELHRRDIDARAAFGGFTGATLLSDAMTLDGSPTQRLRVRRHEVGEPVTRSFGDWLGVMRCATEADDVRRLWDVLLAREAQSDGVLRGGTNAVLDIPDALVSAAPAGRLHVSMRRLASTASPRVVAVPRFAYVSPPRKLRNFGHWLLDCAPQIVALTMVAPEATILLPGPLRAFHRWTLLELGLRDSQILQWDGSPVACPRLLVFESDGRTGGGRPLSALMQLRSRLRAGGDGTGGGRTRRIYVSRRDARAKRRWAGNQAAIEALFRERGFEVLSMAECPLDEQARIFRDARVVAGVSGAGLTNLIFSAPGTHAIVLVSDSLIRWYADGRGSRSLWARGVRGGRGQLAALGDSPRFYAHLAAAFEQVCHYFVGSDEMPIDRLSEFLDTVLAQDPSTRSARSGQDGS